MKTVIAFELLANEMRASGDQTCKSETLAAFADSLGLNLLEYLLEFTVTEHVCYCTIEAKRTKRKVLSLTHHYTI